VGRTVSCERGGRFRNFIMVNCEGSLVRTGGGTIGQAAGYPETGNLLITLGGLKKVQREGEGEPRGVNPLSTLVRRLWVGSCAGARERQAPNRPSKVVWCLRLENRGCSENHHGIKVGKRKEYRYRNWTGKGM